MAGFGDYRSSPTSPGDFLRIPRSPREADLLLREIQAQLQATDYFSREEAARYDGIRTALAGYGDRDGWSLSDAAKLDDIRRINSAAQVANSAVTPYMRHAEIHPKLCTSEGRFPRDFDGPRRVEDFLSMENSTLDRILIAYNLPRDSISPLRRTLPFDHDRDFFGLNLESSRFNRILTLFEYLGVNTSDERRLGGSLGGGLSGGFGGARLGGFGSGRLLR